MSMLARVLVLSLGLTCGMASGLVGLKWFIGGITQSAAVEPKRADTDPKVQRMVSRYDWMWYASIPMIIWTAPLGLLGGVLGGMGRGKIASIPLFLAMMPTCISGWTLFVTFGLFFAGCLGFLIRAGASQPPRGSRAPSTPSRAVQHRREGCLPSLDPNVPKTGKHLTWPSS